MSEQTEFEKFYHWIQANGGQIHPHIRIDTREERGLFTTKEIPSHSALIVVPFSLILTANRMENKFADKSDQLRLIIFLLYEYLKGDQSFWFPWLRLLNIDQEKKDFLTRQMQLYDCLEHSTIAQALTARYQQLQEDYDELSKSFTDLQFDFDLFATIDHLVWSRILELPDGIGVSLVPSVDFANHSLNPNARWFINDEKTQLILRSERLLSSNEEITISYGDKSNEELLYLYGFALENNHNDRVTIPVSLSPEDPLLREKLHLIQENHLPPRLILDYQGHLTEASKFLATILSSSSMETMNLCPSSYLIELYEQYKNDLSLCSTHASSFIKYYLDSQKRIIQQAIDHLH